MPWIRDKYEYGIMELARIGETYYHPYDDIDDKSDLAVDKKIDYDRALGVLSRDKKRFMKLWMGGVEDTELGELGYIEPDKLRKSILEEMKRYLNGGKG